MRLLLLVLATSGLYAAENAVLVTPGDALKIKALAKSDPALAASLRENAAAVMKKGPWSVIDARPQGVKDLSLNEYYSEGPYWWPDPKNPSGPYIRRDGERYPDRFTGNRAAIGHMSDAVVALGMASYFLDDAAAAKRCAETVAVWFVNPKTRMNPGLEYGQAIRNVNNGRGAGIIDTVALIRAVQGMALLERSGKWDAAAAASVKQWFRDYIKWLTTSKKGLDEKMSGNNHMAWWHAQVAAYACWVGDDSTQKMVWSRYPELLAVEFRPDGSAPKEEARTKSLSYSVFNADALATLCRIAQANGVDLWRRPGTNGFQIKTAFAHILPFLTKSTAWQKQQIADFDSKSAIFPALAGLGLPDAELLRVYSTLPHPTDPWLLLVNCLVRSGG